MVVLSASASTIASSSKLSLDAACRTVPTGANSSRRWFQSSARAQNHYDTLSLPRNASKGQIKSSYYKLSKQYHPDLNKDPASKDTFQKVGEAYAILGDERKRRAYDRQLAESGGSSRHFASSSGSSHAPGAGYWAYETRRRPGATHAWQRQGPTGSRHPGQNPPPGYGPRPGSSPYTHPQAGPQYHQDPFSSPHVRRATGSSKAHQPTEADRVNHVSTFWRTMQVIGIVLFVATVGGGYSANA